MCGCVSLSLCVFVCVADGYHVVYDRECPFEMRLQHAGGSQEVGPIEAVKVKILLKVMVTPPIQLLASLPKQIIRTS